MIESELRSTLTKDFLALEFPRARLMFRRPSKYGASTYATISAYWSNTTTKRRGLACELLGELARRSRSARRGHQRRRLKHTSPSDDRNYLAPTWEEGFDLGRD